MAPSFPAVVIAIAAAAFYIYLRWAENERRHRRPPQPEIPKEPEPEPAPIPDEEEEEEPPPPKPPPPPPDTMFGCMSQCQNTHGTFDDYYYRNCISCVAACEERFMGTNARGYSHGFCKCTNYSPYFYRGETLCNYERGLPPRGGHGDRRDIITRGEKINRAHTVFPSPLGADGIP